MMRESWEKLDDYCLWLWRDNAKHCHKDGMTEQDRSEARKQRDKARYAREKEQEKRERGVRA